MVICKLNDCDWYIGDSLESCVKQHLSDSGDQPEDPYVLSDIELDQLIFTDRDENELFTSAKRSFREQLAVEVEEGGEFPRLFASTEY